MMPTGPRIDNSNVLVSCQLRSASIFRLQYLLTGLLPAAQLGAENQLL